jgi:hypothetical protein
MRPHTSIRLSLWAGAGLFVVLGAGCVAAGAAGGAALALALGLALLGAGCTASHEPAGLDAAVDAGDAGDADGYWEPCCEDGAVSVCFCPADVACNYGWFTDCGDGTCVWPDSTCPDAGTWEPCCDDGVITTCFCPAGAICNYGLYVDCGGGACTHGEECPAAP